ncbi:MAG: RagB/SusD family nutrient uptake outer membrane protein [Bacteroidales bacterium]|nr:RagB/SusD family nutrient uptake outer membrane protein [Bacteroidales bacterium]
MKKIFLILFSASAVVTGCSDVLNTIPTDRLSSEIYWQTDQDAEYASNAVYRFLEGPGTIISRESMTDIARSTFQNSAENPVELGVADALSGIFSSAWSDMYRGIRRCNDYLANVDKITPKDVSLVKQYTAEVRTLRAYYYSRLVSYFGAVPLIKEPISISESKEITRTPVSEIYDFIETELNEAVVDLPVNAKVAGRITRGAALGILARTMLFAAGNVTGDDARSSSYYQKAKNAADAVISLGKYSLFKSYENMFLYANENNCEVILDVQYIKDYYSNSVMNNFGPVSLGNNGSSVSVSKVLVDEYETVNGLPIDKDNSYDPYHPYDNRDPRLGYTIFYPGSILPNGTIFNSIPGCGSADAIGASYQVSKTGLNPRKYLNPEDIGTSNRTNCGINFVLLRYAEILLTAAEARIEMNQDLEGARNLINQIRSREDVAMPPVSASSQEDLRKAVRHERMVELALEGNRFFDVRRWKIAEQVCTTTKVEGIQYVDENGKLVTWSEDFPKKFTAKDYLWPIPYNERQLCPGLTQNDGWN